MPLLLRCLRRSLASRPATAVDFVTARRSWWGATLSPAAWPAVAVLMVTGKLIGDENFGFAYLRWWVDLANRHGGR
ncbi:MAG: hypothetical protein H0T47_05650 [Planctomycetaceae bacterium]|nr:hypothetical protein [Planctomycetaceae bacterium]